MSGSGRRVPRADLVLTVVLLVIFAAAWLQTGGWPSKSALFPRIVSGASVVLALVMLIALVGPFGKTDAGAGNLPPPGGAEAQDEDADLAELEYVFENSDARTWTVTLGWVALFFLSLYVVGLFVTAPAFALMYLRFAAKTSWSFAFAYAAVLAAVFYVGFGLLLKQPVPPGLF